MWSNGLIGFAVTVLISVFLFTVGTVSYRHGVSYSQAMLSSGNVKVRDAAARKLGQIGPKASPAVPDLLVVLRTDVPQVASSAAWALGNIQAPQRHGQLRNQDVIPALIEALDHPDGEVRRYAAYAISLIGPAALSAVPKLSQKLTDQHMAYMAARALGEMGPAARSSIPAMTALLSSSHAGERAEAAVALSRLGPLPAETVSAIEKLLNDEVDFVRDAASKAISPQPP
jgi:HEAT repeat protein